ncbi:MAG TPA: DUF3048 domain-containing protein [Clostridiales bacterium UBA8153]|nr:DUF3048 domain-containing protein [Clostridiales bacterium UBA8153]
MLLVAIGNNRAARPQSGVEFADVVYEVLAEGGITRLLALFGSRAAPDIGPVRSLRMAMAEIALGYDAPLAHAGGCEEALRFMARQAPKSLDGVRGAGAFFRRVTHRKAPDNLYTSTGQLIEGARARGLRLSPLVRLPHGDRAGGDPATRVVVAFARLVNAPNIVTYEYDGRVYRRSVNDSPHLSAQGQQLAPENLVVLEVKTRTVMRQEPMLDMDVVGQGRALLFRDGRVHAGTWQKTGPGAMFVLRDTQGQLFTFARGQTWFHLVPDLKYVEYR